MKHYTLVDYVSQGYIAIIGLLVLCVHHDTVPGWFLVVLAHAIGLGLIHGLIQYQSAHPTQLWLKIVRSFYPLVLLLALYCETGFLNRMFITHFLDPFFLKLEHTLFGTQPSIVWMEQMPWPWLSELFYCAYFTYYLMIVGIGVALFRQSRSQFSHYLTVVVIIMVVCFAIYIILPVTGPSVFYRSELRSSMALPSSFSARPLDIPSAIQSGVFYRLMAVIYQWFESPGAAFPSSHVAIALTTLYFSCHYLRRVCFPHGILVLLLCASTVYCHYHYVVDVIAGVLTAVVLLPFANWLYFYCEPTPADQPLPALCPPKG